MKLTPDVIATAMKEIKQERRDEAKANNSTMIREFTPGEMFTLGMQKCFDMTNEGRLLRNGKMEEQPKPPFKKAKPFDDVDTIPTETAGQDPDDDDFDDLDELGELDKE
jgi:hypothetical protein